MRKEVIIFTIALVLAFVLADEEEKKETVYTYDNDVLVLDEGNFYEAIDKYEYLFLEWYAPWCGHWYLLWFIYFLS